MIITLEQAKNVNPNTTQDTLNGFEAAIRQLTNNRFHVKEARWHKVTIQGNTITLGEGAVGVLKTGDTLQLGEAGVNDNLLVVIDTIESNALTFTVQKGVNDADLLVDGEYGVAFATLVRYPADIKQGLNKLLAYDLTMGAKVGIKSETISRLSVTYFDVSANENILGYPAALFAFVKPYFRVRWG